MCKIVVNRKIIEETEEALSCPFCKSTNLRIGSCDMGGGYNSYYVHCNKCDAKGPEISTINATPRMAVRAWNNR